jgi:hypothetical protein
MMYNVSLTEEDKLDCHILILMKRLLMWWTTEFLCRFRRATVVQTLRLTDAFIWEDLPPTDPDTGSVAMVAWIPRIQRISFFITSVATIFHVIQSTVRLLTSDNRPMFYRAWYPFDTIGSPAYELTNIAQVTMSVVRYCSSVCFILRGTEYNFHQMRTIWQMMFMLSENFIKSLHNHVFCL